MRMHEVQILIIQDIKKRNVNWSLGRKEPVIYYFCFVIYDNMVTGPTGYILKTEPRGSQYIFLNFILLKMISLAIIIIVILNLMNFKLLCAALSFQKTFLKVSALFRFFLQI